MKQLLKRELIGRNIEVTGSANKSLVGIKGKIIDETKNTIVVVNGNRRKVLLKKQIQFAFTVGDKRVKIDGSKLIKRPEKRIEIR